MNQESIQQILSIFDSKEGEFTEEIQSLKKYFQTRGSKCSLLHLEKHYSSRQKMQKNPQFKIIQKNAKIKMSKFSPEGLYKN